MTTKQFSAKGGIVFDTRRALYDSESGRVVIREKGRSRKPKSLAHTTGDPLLDKWLADQQSRRAPAPTWDDDVPF